MSVFEPRQSSWNLDDVLPLDYHLSPGTIESIPEYIHSNFLTLLGRDVYSEGDSQPLFDYIMGRKREFTPDFVLMIEKWFEDEQKHYEALRRVYHLVGGVSYEKMDIAFAQRIHEIEPITEILKDEFTILVAFLFDEMGSTISYRRDVWEYYQHYGTQVRRIGKNLVMDEGIHFNNAVGVIEKNHSHRIKEIPSLLNRIAQLEYELGRYCKTFFLDHAQEQFRFPANFNQVLIEIILARFGLAQYPLGANNLWRWKPDGLSLVPTTPPTEGKRHYFFN